MRAKRSLGQNFLIDKNLQKKIVAAVGAGPDDEVVEIGPGRGALTAHLAERVRRLALVELDDALAERLRETYAGSPHVHVLHGDVLDVALSDVAEDPDRAIVVGNIPYNITTPIVFHLLERPRPASIVLLVQKEVAERLVAPPGTSAYGALAVGVRTVARVERLFDVGRSAFRPVPKVDSALVRIVPARPPILSQNDEAPLRVLTRAAFQWRRKQMQKILRDHPDLQLTREDVEDVERETGYEMTRRPETFSPDDFIRLSRLVVARKAPAA